MDNCIYNENNTCIKCGFHSKYGRVPRNCQPLTQQILPVINTNKTQIKIPSLTRKLLNFTQSAIGHIFKGMPTCTQKQIDFRFNICKQCPHFKIDSNNIQIGSCNACGCPLSPDPTKLASKLAWADQSCPVGKWGPIEKKEGDNDETITNQEDS